jgi:hypothetical protein
MAKKAKGAKGSSYVVPSVAAEFAGADLGDPRRDRRLASLAEAFSAAPDKTLPQIARDDAELEALYRFLANEHFAAAELLEPHYSATAERIQGQQTVIAIADITDFHFPLGEHLRDGCGVFGLNQGFRCSVTLALAADGSNRPLGVLNSESWICEPKKRARKAGKKKAPNTWGRTEGARWDSWAQLAEGRVPEGTRVIHVSDREASTYEVFASALSRSSGFVIRCLKGRSVALEEGDELLTMHDAAAKLDIVYELTVPLSRRSGQYLAQTNPPRDARIARLGFRAAPIRLRRPKYQPTTLPAEIELNLVCVTEINAPEGEEPVEWLLATTESIATREDVIRVVETYRARWVIEEFFKAIKTGCRFESRQLESYESLTKLLSIVLVVAWRMLLLRQETRISPDAPATRVLTELQIMLLQADRKARLKANPTVRDALLAVAALGGHIKNNGDPGWLVLYRGMECLIERTLGCVATIRLLAGLQTSVG